MVAREAWRRVSSPAFGLVLLGLLFNVFSGEGFYANLDYAFPLLALFGAAGCIGQLAVSIYRRPVTLASACSIPVEVSRSTVEGYPLSRQAWPFPVLMALLFGPFVALLAGLGGWV